MLLQGAIAAELLAQPPPCQNAGADLPQITQWPGYDHLSVPLLFPSPVTQSCLGDMDDRIHEREHCPLQNTSITTKL